MSLSAALLFKSVTVIRNNVIVAGTYVAGCKDIVGTMMMTSWQAAVVFPYFIT